MTQEEKDALLEEAKRRYPIGTNFISLEDDDDRTDTVTLELRWQGWGISHPGILWVYRNGQWAEIVSNPEVKEELTALPEKWCIKDCEEVSIWAASKFDCDSGVGDSYLHVPSIPGSTYTYSFGLPDRDWTEITLDQFKKWVLKKNEVPEYVECKQWVGTSYTKGEIYPVVDELVMNLKPMNNTIYVARFDEIQHFKPSTKEAYDAQQIKTVEPVKLERKTATELGFKVGDKFTVVDDASRTFKIGDVVTLVEDDESFCPYFKDQTGYSAYCYFSDLTPYIESDVPVEEDMNAILEEAKRRFPVGCTFYPVYSSSEVDDTARLQSTECHLCDNNTAESPWIIGSWTVRNSNGQWAQIISMPEEDLTGRYLECMVDRPQSTNFKKGDYVRIERKISDKCYMIENSWTYSMSSNYVSHFKLMPVGWIPGSNDPFRYAPEDSMGGIDYCLMTETVKTPVQEPIEDLFRPSRII